MFQKHLQVFPKYKYKPTYFGFPFLFLSINYRLILEACEVVSGLSGRLGSFLSANFDMAMGEIDTKHIEPVQVAITLFGEKSDHRKPRSGSSNSSTGDEMEIEELHKELANYKVQAEAKDGAHSQLLHKLEQYKQTQEELLNQLKNSEIERDVYFEEYTEASHRIDELEAKAKEMTHQLSETGKLREQLSHVLLQLKASQSELLCVETELASAQDAKLKALAKVELLEAAEKDENGKKIELENQLMAKKLLIDSLQVELNQANELLSSSDKVVSGVIDDMNKLKSDLKEKEEENYDQGVRIGGLETEMSQLKHELKNANDEVSQLNFEAETLTDELEKAKTEMEKAKGRENEAEIEIAMLKAELHKGRSKLAAAEAAEERARNAKYEEECGNRSMIIAMEDADKAKKSEETEKMRKEMEAAMAKVSEFRTRAEQARTRAEAAERAKMLLEDQLRKWREQKQRRKAALAALREESLSREFGASSYENETTPKNYQPLGKVLNMKF